MSSETVTLSRKTVEALARAASWSVLLSEAPTPATPGQDWSSEDDRAMERVQALQGYYRSLMGSAEVKARSRKLHFNALDFALALEDQLSA